MAICPRLRSDIPFFCLGCVVHIFGYFLFSFSLLFARKCIFEGIFSRMHIFLFFSTALLLLFFFLFLFRYPLQDLQKATTWGDMCGSRRQRMVQQLLSSRATSSVKKYVLHYKGFLKYWRSKGIIVTLPCDSLLITEYLSYLQDAKNSYAVLSLAFSALKWVHNIIPHGPLGNPVDTTLSRNIIEASKRLFSRPINKKEPVTPDMIHRICLVFARVDSNLKDLCSVLLFVLGFHGLFRISELLDLQAVDVTIHTEYLEILIKSSKTDQYREGNKVFISKLGGIACPHALLCRYFASARIDPNFSVYIFRAVRFFKRTNMYLLCSNKLSYTRARELIKETLSAIGIDSKGFSSHSLRAGGVTFIAKNLPRSDGSDRLLMLRGRWRSEQAKNMYVKEPLESRLQLTRFFPSF